MFGSQPRWKTQHMGLQRALNYQSQRPCPIQTTALSREEQAEHLAKLNLSPDTLYAFLHPSPLPQSATWGARTPEPKVSHTSLESQSHTTHPTSSESPRYKSMGEFFPLVETHDQETQTDEIHKVKIAPPTPPRPTYEITQMEGYLIINGVKYIPETPPPLQHTVETQTDKPSEFKAIDVLKTSGRILDSNPFVNCKKDKIPIFKPYTALKTDKILDSQPAAAKVEKIPESKLAAAFSRETDSSLNPAASFRTDKVSNLKPAAALKDEKFSVPKPAGFFEGQKAFESTLSIPPDVKKTLESKTVAAKIAEAFKHLPTPPESLHRTHSIPPKLPSLSIDIPTRFELSGEGSNSDDEFLDI